MKLMQEFKALHTQPFDWVVTSMALSAIGLCLLAIVGILLR